MWNKVSVAAAVVLGVLVVGRASAQVRPDLYYDENVKRAGVVGALNDDLFGDSISMVDGRVSFRQIDVSLNTNSELKVEFGRRTPHAHQGREPATVVLGLDWEIDAPYLLATLDTRYGWIAGDSGELPRCSGGKLSPPAHNGPWPYYHQMMVQQHTWWKGIDIHIPGKGARKMLELAPGAQLPTDGKVYIATAAGNLMMSCLPAIQNGGGEGFMVHTPDGMQYRFDWVARRNANDSFDNATSASSDYDNGSYDSWHTMTPLTDYFLYATQVRDRFGNYVNYIYDPQNPHRLTRIESNDGASIVIGYNSQGLVSSATANGRQWLYEYATVAAIPTPWNMPSSYRLSRVVNPDGSDWEISVTGFPFETKMPGDFWNYCNMDAGSAKSGAPLPANEDSRMVITHPSGAIGDFRFRTIVHGKNRSPGGCSLTNAGEPDGSNTGTYSYSPYGVPAAYAVRSIFGKTISGPGMANAQWAYTYFPSWSFDADWQSPVGYCASGPCNFSRTQVQKPDGSFVIYTFGNDYKYNDGQLLKVEHSAASNVIETKVSTYLAVGTTGMAFPSIFGIFPKGRCLNMYGYPATIDRCSPYGNPIGTMHLPLTSEVINRDGRNFARSYPQFDARARPTQVIKSSSP